jgi:hypothetical protein
LLLKNVCAKCKQPIMAVAEGTNSYGNESGRQVDNCNYGYNLHDDSVDAALFGLPPHGRHILRVEVLNQLDNEY